MFDLRRHANPGVFAAVVDRNRRRGKARLRKGSHCDDDEFLATFETPVNSSPAAWTEVKGDSVPFITDTDILV
jgi:hypothetical protein